MDVIGEPGPLADAEVIAAAIDIMRELGLGHDEVRVRMSDRQVMRTLLLAAGVDEDTLGVAYTAIDRIEREDRGKSADRLTAAGINKDVVDRLFEIGTLRGLENTLAALSDVRGGDEAGEHLATCHGALTSMGLGDFLDVDLSIVRGLAYYTGIVYELFDAARSLRAICGGGRYDGLLAALASLGK